MPSLVDVRSVSSTRPVIAYLNRAFDGSFSSSGAADGYPAAAARTYATYEGWRPASASATLSSAYAVAYPTSYIGAVIIGAPSGATVLAQYSTDGVSYETVSGSIDAATGTALWLFDAVQARFVRLLVSGMNVAGARVAVLMAGSATVLQRSIYVGHTPLDYARQTVLASNRSESGQFLGRIIRRESNATGVTVSNLTAAYYRQSLDPVFVAMRSQPIFWAWRPQPSVFQSDTYATESDVVLTTETDDPLQLEESTGVYSDDVSYAWMRGDPQMVNQRPNGMVQVSFDLESGDFSL